MNELSDGDDGDMSGYLGSFNQTKKGERLEFIADEEFYKAISSELKLIEVFREIRRIDADQNGYITMKELTEILKSIFPKQLGQKDIKPILKPFISIQNKILVDYKLFRDRVIERVFKGRPYNDKPNGKHLP